MQKKPPILPIAIGLGVLAVGGTAFLLSRGPAAPTPATAGPGTPVALAAQPTPVPEMRYIANRDIPPRTVMTADMMRRTAVSGPMPPGAVTSLDDLRGMITSEPIRSGDTITTDSFVKSLGRAIPANFSVPSGFRAVAIYVNPAQTAAGLVDVGDRVDVIATQKLSFDKQPNQFIIGAKEFTTGRTIGTNLLVLAVEKSLNAPVVKPTPTPAPGAAPGAAPAAAPADGALPADAAAPPSGGTAPAETRADAPAKPEGNIRVILAAPLETASRLVSANEGGTLHVVVRNPLDGDAEASPETREYPSRTITVRQPTGDGGDNSGGGGGGGGGGGRGGGSGGPAFPVPDLPPVTVSQNAGSPSPMPMPVPASPSGGGEMTMPSGTGIEPSGPPMRDVMVVRGTEKTRVIVPKR